ncbi:MAG: hypothetical protein QG670_2367 [Thermoproteota archaeon]|nr:hypothetical protein [Thermoproteota archaeon]
MIPSSLYKQIQEVMPIPSIEAVIMSEGFLLFLKRKNSPAKGEWWFPGGRIRKGETFKETLFREVKEETGLDVKIIEFIGVYNRIFPERHDITIVFLCRCFDEKVILNDEHSEFKFSKDIPSNIHPYLLETIADMKKKMS